MNDLTTAEHYFFHRTGMNESEAESIVNDALVGMDDGELFLEYSQSEHLSFDDGKLKQANFDSSQGFGLRSVQGDTVGYAHATEITPNALRRAAHTVRSLYSPDITVNLTPSPQRTNHRLYSDDNPLHGVSFADKVTLLQQIDHYLREKNPLVSQVSVTVSTEWQVIEIIRQGGEKFADVRPLVRIDISVVVDKDGRMERGHQGAGGRKSFQHYTQPDIWQTQANKALTQALTNLDARPTPAGEMQVVLGPGWPGILLHEAIGHGLEGDFNRKQTSAFSGLIGERVASKGVTVVDDGTIKDRRGSLTIDDEGTPSSCTTLIEDGILVGYMQDRLNARLMGAKPTGNGRRESFAHKPLPRMTNTYMLSGDAPQADIISSVKNGIYAANFGGGQVDITSGKFVFSASEAYKIENGQITYPLKGATLVGNGPDVLTRVTAIGNDMQLDDGIGTCGKDGQGVPVGVGQPSLLIDGITVGGTEV